MTSTPIKPRIPSVCAVSIISELKNMGYECAQLAGSINTIEMTAEACAKASMPVVGILVNMDMCENEREKIFSAARLCGASDIGISSSASNDEAADNLLARANAFKKIAEAAGFSFSYHNHSHEFIKCECGKTVMDRIAEEFEGDLMPDTYWIQHGGADVRSFIEKHANKIKMLHLKDMKMTAEGQTFAEIGMGNLDMNGILKTATDKGIECFIVEQDKCDGDPLCSARISIENIKKMM